ncbi:TatD family hydrolase [Streptomyces sp.]|uniref:TatD family hydrolase n=1 Tax=Streptomyces sp. TaxID=1931 RepID=UPI0025D536B7|nr:TatD family hydrolase [Streptomyces sp.]
MSRGSRSQEEPPPAPEPLAVAVADSHCHLDIMGGDVQAQLDLALSVGIDTVVQVGVDVESSRLSADLAARFDSVWATVALHPNEAGKGAATREALQEIERLAQLPQVRGVGETGLDHFRTGPEGRDAQEDSFRAHIAIAKETGKALVIHDRDAHDDVLRVLREEGAPEVTVFHCFSGDAAMARTCAEVGWYLSFAGPVTFKPNDELRAAAAVCPQDRVLVETDAPFLTPMPFRGRPNAPYLVPHTMRSLAATRGEDLDELCAAVAANTRRAFSLP